MEARTVKVTPALAKRLLDNEKKEISKDLNKLDCQLYRTEDFHNDKLLRFEDELTNGNWIEDYNPILVSEYGFILDGYYRLMAVLNSGVSYYGILVTEIDINKDSELNKLRESRNKK